VTGTARDLDYYNEHLDEVPTDEEGIARLLAQVEGEEPPAAAPENKEGSDEAQSAPPAPADTSPVVLTRDGKHTIPYEVHAQYRARAQQAEAEAERARALEARLAEAEAKLAQAAATGEAPTAAQAEDWETLEKELAEEYPEKLVKAFRALREQVKSAAPAAPAAVPSAPSAPETVGTEEVERIQDAIDQLPQLARWRESQGREWEVAVAVDKRLRDDPQWKDSPYRDRFAQVVRVITGKEPETTTPRPGAGPENKNSPQNDIDAEVERLLARAASQPPRSISDIPGGSPPAQNEREKVEDLSPLALAQLFEGKSEEQIEQILARAL
jgi:hypothetical protein